MKQVEREVGTAFSRSLCNAAVSILYSDLISRGQWEVTFHVWEPFLPIHNLRSIKGKCRNSGAGLTGGGNSARDMIGSDPAETVCLLSIIRPSV